MIPHWSYTSFMLLYLQTMQMVELWHWDFTQMIVLIMWLSSSYIIELLKFLLEAISNVVILPATSLTFLRQRLLIAPISVKLPHTWIQKSSASLLTNFLHRLHTSVVAHQVKFLTIQIPKPLGTCDNVSHILSLATLEFHSKVGAAQNSFHSLDPPALAPLAKLATKTKEYNTF